MPERHPTRKQLARQFSRTSEHSQAEIERALSAFIDPNNPNMSLDSFSNQLIRRAIGTGRRNLTEDDQNLAQGLQEILEDVRNARLFNDRYIGHLLSEASIPGMLGYMMATRIGSNTVAREVSIAESRLEPGAIEALNEIVGYDPKISSGTFTSGGSLANMTALAVARELERERIVKAGEGVMRMRVLTSPFAHYSVAKMCNVLGGPGRQIELERVESHNLRMSPDDLEEKIKEARQENIPIMAVVAIAGETETGLVDPLKDIADITQRHEVNLIVDGAYGAPYRLSRVGNKFEGMERAVAITIDPHKALYTPYNNGAVLFRNPGDHALLNVGVEAAYTNFRPLDPTSPEYQRNLQILIGNLRSEPTPFLDRFNLGEKRIEGSMSAGPILSTLAVWKTLGPEGLAVIYDLTLDRASYLHERVGKSPYLEPSHEAELNMLCFTLNEETRRRLRISPDMLETFIDNTREELDKGMRGEGGYYFSSTTLPNLRDSESPKIGVFRSCIMHPRTTNAILDEAISGLETIIEDRIRQSPNS